MAEPTWRCTASLSFAACAFATSGVVTVGITDVSQKALE